VREVAARAVDLAAARAVAEKVAEVTAEARGAATAVARVEEEREAVGQAAARVAEEMAVEREAEDWEAAILQG